MIPLCLAVEDELSEFFLRRVLYSKNRIQVSAVYGKEGFGYLKKRAVAFNKASRFKPFLMLTDLDQGNCPPDLIRDWLAGTRKNPNFLFRIAIPQVESWVLADSKGFQSFLGLRRSFSIPNPEKLHNAKEKLLEIVEKVRSRDLREALVTRNQNGERRQGPDYNGVLGRFIRDSWNLDVAARCCPSLSKLIKSVDLLENSLQ